MQRTKRLADELNTGIHMHVAEIKVTSLRICCSINTFEKEEVDFCKEHRGKTTVSHLHDLGALGNVISRLGFELMFLIGSNLLAVHSVWLTDYEVDLIKQYEVGVVHCPAAAMR